MSLTDWRTKRGVESRGTRLKNEGHPIAYILAWNPIKPVKLVSIGFPNALWKFRALATYENRELIKKPQNWRTSPSFHSSITHLEIWETQVWVRIIKYWYGRMPIGQCPSVRPSVGHAFVWGTRIMRWPTLRKVLSYDWMTSEKIWTNFAPLQARRWTFSTPLVATARKPRRLSFWPGKSTAAGRPEIGLLKDLGCRSGEQRIHLVMHRSFVWLVFPFYYQSYG